MPFKEREVLGFFIVMLLDKKYFLSFHRVRTRTNQEVFRRMSVPHPCEKHSFSKFGPHTCSDCPCALLMVIAKVSRTGNRRRLNLNGISVIINLMRDNRKSPLNFPYKMVASVILFIIFLTWYRCKVVVDLCFGEE